MLETDNEIHKLETERDQLRSRIKEIADRLHMLRMRKRRAKPEEVVGSFDDLLRNYKK